MTRSPAVYQIFRDGQADPIGEAASMNLARSVAFAEGGDRITNTNTGEVLTIPRTAWLPSAHAAVITAGAPAPAMPDAPATPLPRVAALGVGWGEMTVLGVGRSHEAAEEAAARDFPGVAVAVFAELSDEQAARVADGQRDARGLGLGDALLAVDAG